MRENKHGEKASRILREQLEIAELLCAESLLFEIAEGKEFDLFLPDGVLRHMNGRAPASIRYCLPLCIR